MNTNEHKVSAVATVESFNSALWKYHFVVPNELAKQFVEGNDRRVICTVNRTEELRCALMPRNGTYFILLNNAVRKRLKLTLGETLEYTLQKDRSEYGFEMPEELQEALSQNKQAQDAFHQLTKGKQRSLIYIVVKVKSSDSRIRKALAIAHHLEESEGELDFKRLNELIKHYNRLK